MELLFAGVVAIGMIWFVLWLLIPYLGEHRVELIGMLLAIAFVAAPFVLLAMIHLR